MAKVSFQRPSLYQNFPAERVASCCNGLPLVSNGFEALDVGTVVVNHTTAVRVETLPFGGNKGSGNGREGIHDTLHEMSKVKTLLLHEVFGAAV